MQNVTESRRLFYEYLKQVRSDYSKCLDHPDLSPSERAEILNRLAETVRIANEKDSELRNQEREIEDKVNKKETEKRSFDWKLAGACAMVCITVACVGAGVLGGKFDFKPPIKS